MLGVACLITTQMEIQQDGNRRKPTCWPQTGKLFLKRFNKHHAPTQTRKTMKKSQSEYCIRTEGPPWTLRWVIVLIAACIYLSFVQDLELFGLARLGLKGVWLAIAFSLASLISALASFIFFYLLVLPRIANWLNPPQ